MLRLLSPELVAISPPDDIQSETDVIDLLCYYKSLFNHFQNTNKMELADIVSLNTPNHSPFDRIDSCSENEVARMAEIGRRKYGNPTTPFSNTVTAKTPGYIASVINGFDPYFQRIVPMWTTETNINTTMFQCMHRVIYGDILQNGIDKNRCIRLVMLMTEALAIANYMNIDATPLNQRIKFWSISFLYSMYSRRWDTAPDHRAWVNASIETSIRAHDQMRAAVFNKTNNCFRRISRWSTSLSRLRRIMTLPRSEEDERVLVNTQITTLLGLDSGGKINITPEQEAAFNTAIQNARDVIHTCETLANMAEVLLGDPVAEIVNPQEEEEEIPVAPARTQWLDQQINRMMRQAVNDIVEEYVEEGEGQAKKRNNRAKNQRRKQAARNAKAAAMEEVASTLDGMCKLVAEQTVVLEHKRIEEEERKRIEEENRQQMEVWSCFIHRFTYTNFIHPGRDLTPRQSPCPRRPPHPSVGLPSPAHGQHAPRPRERARTHHRMLRLLLRPRLHPLH